MDQFRAKFCSCFKRWQQIGVRTHNYDFGLGICFGNYSYRQSYIYTFFGKLPACMTLFALYFTRT